jgi:hypothetical protein
LLLQLLVLPHVPQSCAGFITAICLLHAAWALCSSSQGLVSTIQTSLRHTCVHLMEHVDVAEASQPSLERGRVVGEGGGCEGVSPHLVDNQQASARTLGTQNKCSFCSSGPRLKKTRELSELPGPAVLQTAE